MLIGLVSDTHDDLAAVERAVALFDRIAVDALIHCGDFVSPFSVAPFTEFVADSPGIDFYAVRGNNDGEWAIQSAVDAAGTYLGEAGVVSFSQAGASPTEVAITHGTAEVVVDALVDCGDYDYVVHGHTHAHDVEARGDTVRVNPGGLPIPVDGADDEFRVATLDTTSTGPSAVTHHVLSE